MSTEAIAFSKLVELGEHETASARLLLYVIAENTFNDSGLCRVGKAELALQLRMSASTVLRQCKTLEQAGRIKVHLRPGAGEGRKPDDIELIGFKQWLSTQRAAFGVSTPAEPQHLGGQSVNLPERGNPSKSTKTGGGNPSLMTGSYKESRTSSRTRKEPNNSQFEKKEGGIRPAIPITFGSASWRAWIEHLKGKGRDDLAEAAEVSGAMTAAARWPKANSPLPVIDRAAGAARALTERMTGEAR